MSSGLQLVDWAIYPSRSGQDRRGKGNVKVTTSELGFQQENYFGGVIRVETNR